MGICDSFCGKNKENDMTINFNIDYSKILGKGPFGTVYLGTSKTTNEQVAIKMEKKNPTFSYISKEIEIYKKLNSCKSVPKVFWNGSYNEYNVLIIELLGISLEKLFNLKYNKFSISETKTIGIKILDILENIHKKNIIHRDLKTDCFLLKGNDFSDFSEIYIINFGNAKEYIDPKTEQHIPFSNKNSFVGNYKFASKNSFLNYEQSRRDDIESLGYILIYFLKGFLPWKDSNDFNYIKNLKLSISIDTLCEGLPFGIKQFIKYSWNLKFNEIPDYDYLKNLLINCENIDLSVLSDYNNEKSIDNKEGSFSSPVICASGGSVAKISDISKSFIHLDDKKFETASALSAIFVDNEVKNIIEKKYIKNSESFNFNKILRTQGPFGLNEEDLKLFYALLDAINSQETNKNLLVFRYVDNNYLRDVFNFIPSKDNNYNLSMIMKQIGSIKIEKAFMSCFMTEKHIIERNIKLKIKIPKGTNAYITQNKEESEIILSYNTKYKILNATIEDNNIIQIEIIILNDKNNFINSQNREINTLPLRIVDFLK